MSEIHPKLNLLCLDINIDAHVAVIQKFVFYQNASRTVLKSSISHIGTLHINFLKLEYVLLTYNARAR